MLVCSCPATQQLLSFHHTDWSTTLQEKTKKIEEYMTGQITGETIEEVIDPSGTGYKP